MSKEKNPLGRGLSALISETTLEMIKNGSYNANISNDPVIDDNKMLEIPLDSIQPSSEQPRKSFSQKELQELADSISKHGVLQPLLVTEQPNGFYKIIAGERRWRAARLAGFQSVPVIIKKVDNSTLFEIAIIENIQREDLKPLEEAAAYDKLINEFHYTQEVIATRLGKSRSHIANMLRLLKLPQHIQNLVNNSQISAGHARAVMNSADPITLVNQILEQKLTVREAEELARRSKDKKPRVQEISVQAKVLQTSINPSNDIEYLINTRELDDDILAIENNVSKKISMDVKICQIDNKNYIIVKANDMSELDRFINFLNPA